MQFAALALFAAGTGVQIRGQQIAGKAIQIERKQQIQQETDAARDRDIERRRRLVTALASQNAEAGALGVANSGSRSALAITDASNAARDSLTDRAMTGRRALLLKAQGKEARNQANIQSAATLMDAAATGYKAFGK